MASDTPRPESPRTFGRALAVAAVLTAGTAAAVAAGAGRVAAAAPLACNDGVVVVVDLSAFPGGSIVQACDTAIDAGRTTGLDVLESTRLAVDGTAQYGLAFVCRIDGQPSDQACASTPPASASWSYWHSAPGGDSWVLSSLGASSYCPALGTVEGWAFGDQARPADPPSAFTSGAPTGGPSPACETATPVPTTAPAAPAPATTAVDEPSHASPSAPATSVGSHPSPAGAGAHSLPGPVAAGPATTTCPVSGSGLGPAPAPAEGIGTGCSRPSSATTPTTAAPVPEGGSASAGTGGFAPAGSSMAAALPAAQRQVAIVDAPVAARLRPGSDAVAPVVIAGLLASALGAGALLTARARRRAGEGER